MSEVNVNDADNNDSVTVDLDQYKDMDWDLLVSSGNGGGSSSGDDVEYFTIYT